MAFQTDGFHNLLAISSSIKLYTCLQTHYKAHMGMLLITSNKLVQVLLMFSLQAAAPWCGMCTRGEVYLADLSQQY